jgi:F/Y rich C-terminus
MVEMLQSYVFFWAIFFALHSWSPGCSRQPLNLRSLPPNHQFQVTPEDSPSTVFSGASASGVWKQLLDQIASLGVTAKTHASGPEMLGLSNLAVTKAIQVRDVILEEWHNSPKLIVRTFLPLDL